MSHSVTVKHNYGAKCERCGASPRFMQAVFVSGTPKFELVCANGCKPKEVAMFKPGDRVKVTGGDYEAFIGLKATVVNCTWMGVVTVDFDESPAYRRTLRYFNKHELTLIDQPVFKVGDKVRIKAEFVDAVNILRVNALEHALSGKVYTIAEGPSRCDLGLTRLTEGLIVRKHHIELASATQFPIGTKVRALKTEYFSQEAGAGAEGVVVDGKPGVRAIPVRLTMLAPGVERCLSDYSSFNYRYNPEDLDIISLPAKVDPSTLKVGDRVIAKRKYELHPVATHAHIALLDGNRRVVLFDDSPAWEAFDKVEFIEVLLPEQPTLKVGDRVRVKRKCDHSYTITATVIDAPYGPGLGVRYSNDEWDRMDSVEVLEVLPATTSSTQKAPAANSYCEASTKATTPTIELSYTVRSTELLLNGRVKVALFREDADDDIDAYDEIAITVTTDEAKSLHVGDEYTLTIAKA